MQTGHEPSAGTSQKPWVGDGFVAWLSLSRGLSGANAVADRAEQKRASRPTHY